MLPGNIFSGAAFKAAALSIVAFVVILAIAGAVIVRVVSLAMLNELSAQIGEEVVLFQRIYQTEGPAELIETADSLATSQLTDQRIVGVFSSGGEHLAGDLALAPGFIGWGTIVKDAGEGEPRRYHANVVTLDDHVIVVGRNLRLLAATRARLVEALVLAGLVVTLVSLLIGYLVSRTVLGKLETMALTLEAVSRGETGRRLPVGAANDQIDRVSRQINRHLDRLSALMDSTRNTIVAIAHDLRTPLNRAFLAVENAADDARADADRDAATLGFEDNRPGLRVSLRFPPGSG